MGKWPSVILIKNGTPDYFARVRCPKCGQYGGIDKEQFDGKVSCICMECGWHATVDWADVLRKETKQLGDGATCAKCSKPIKDEFEWLKEDGVWQALCLKCFEIAEADVTVIAKEEAGNNA